MVKRVEYYEPWNEYIHRRCTRRIGKVTTTYNCSYVEYHDAEYYILTTTNIHKKVSEKVYNKLKKQFGNTNFHDMERNYHSIDGDMLYSVWKGEKLKSESVSAEKIYINKIKASDYSVLSCYMKFVQI